jgi:hypothetical protein
MNCDQNITMYVEHHHVCSIHHISHLDEEVCVKTLEANSLENWHSIQSLFTPHHRRLMLLALVILAFFLDGNNFFHLHKLIKDQLVDGVV